MGDGALIEFASAVDAVTCAIEIQRKLREHNSGGTKAAPIQFRIGINVGDIVIEGAQNEPRCIIVTQPDDESSLMLVGKATESKLPAPLAKEWLTRFCAKG